MTLEIIPSDCGDEECMKGEKNGRRY